MAKKTEQRFVDQDSVKIALTKGNAITRLSFFIWGLGNLAYKQIAHGVILILIELACIFTLITKGIDAIGNFITLGTVEQQEVWNESKGIYEYLAGDNSMLCLLYGVLTFALILVMIGLACVSMKGAYKNQRFAAAGRHIKNFKEELAGLKQENLHTVLLALPITGIVTFTIIPLVFMILMAFTSYDHEHLPPGNLFDWVGLDNFRSMLVTNERLASTFWPVLCWTLTWAILATFSCYFFGILLALLINRKGTKCKGMWRFLFVLSIAVPQFVSLLTMSAIFNANGPMNALLRALHILGETEKITFLTHPTYAKITILIVNLWIGVPYTMLQTTGILQNIPEDLYEAAKVDGANAVVTFFKITMPYMLFVTTPYLITTFVGNVNNFNVIFLLTGGGPEKMEYYYAGRTDLLITWLYKLTITQKDYNLGAVIGIITFVIMATLSLITYRNTGSYKNEDTFQ